MSVLSVTWNLRPVRGKERPFGAAPDRERKYDEQVPDCGFSHMQRAQARRASRQDDAGAVLCASLVEGHDRRTVGELADSVEQVPS